MPRFDLLLLPLLGGYWFLNLFYYTKYYHQRIERQRLIFNSSIVAVFISGIGFLLDSVLRNNFFCIREFLGQLIPFDYNGFNQSLLIFGISPILAMLLNLTLPKNFLFQLILKSRGDQLERIFWESLKQKEDKNKLLMVTTNNNKVYVGFVNNIQKPIGDNYVGILPYFSGYRDKDTQELVITTDYFSIIDRMVEEGKEKMIDSKIGVTIHKSNILFVSKFDQEVFDRFNSY
ncbi:hypothetical protein [Cyclobacterium plantarum]|uniref:Uncharacterized protein n=1 Tax=Cyclobacterium plantarum TaxID=2716263 RepID=A0ABX0HDX4_9BACT|nr:hypothetical protein [Cyclobacterium plantarum]NHE59949.1 hypothetical protein [Cyclobacterium plantarum]